MVSIKRYYQKRFRDSENRNRYIIWKTLCDVWLQKYIKKDATVMDFGAGYCEFLNNIYCGKKIAVDINPDTKNKANKDIEVLNISVLAIPPKWNGKIDVIFMSNFLEHLNSKEEVVRVLEKAYQLLKINGKLLIIQPNIDLVKEAYWDFIDHIIALNIKSLVEALIIAGFEIGECVKRFLPYTSKDNLLPKNGFLVKLYLRLPNFLRPMAGQSFILAIKK